MSIKKIVITGGPGAGKTEGMEKIKEAFHLLSYKVILIPEVATELIDAGISPESCPSRAAFQKEVLTLQLKKEKEAETAAENMGEEKILIACDRGALDSKAYLTETEYHEMLQSLRCDEIVLRDSYDAVFHLVSAAKGAEQFYTTDNNQARTETPEEAARIDDGLIAAWEGHPHFRIIDNESGFDGKIQRLIEEIAAFLGEEERNTKDCLL